MNFHTKIAIALLGSAAALSSMLLAAGKASANQYFENYAGQSYGLTWVELSTPVQRDDHALMGYACFVRDTLQAMSATAVINRYEIRADRDYFYLHPLAAATVYPEGSSYVAVADEPLAEGDFSEYIETDDAGRWYIGDSEVSDFGRACVDGGITGAVGHLEVIHGIEIGR